MVVAAGATHTARVPDSRAVRPTARTLVLGVVAALVATALAWSAPPGAVADVNQSPTAYITGDKTGLDNGLVGDVALDASGARYVPVAAAAKVSVFGPGVAGNVPPTREIKGPATGLLAPRAVMVAPDGRLFVADVLTSGVSIRIFAAGASGDVAPVGVIKGVDTGLSFPQAMAMDPLGRLYVADFDTDQVRVFAPGASGNASPIRIIGGNATGLDDPSGLALDPAGALHVANIGNGSIVSFAAGNSGNVAPVRTISGVSTGLGLPSGLSLDSSGNLYVPNQAAGSVPDSVLVFAPTTPSGDSAPRQRLTGGGTDLNRPTGVAVGPQGQVTVTNSSAILTFAPLPLPEPPASPMPPAVVAPGAVRGLDVAGKPAAPKRKVTWSAPASAGGAPVTGYVVTVAKRAKTLLTRTVTRTGLTLKRKKLAPGRLVVTVVAVNSAGPGAPATVKLRVVR